MLQYVVHLSSNVQRLGRVVCLKSNVLSHFNIFEGFNKPVGHLITPPWNGGGPNERTSLYYTPRHFGTGSHMGM